MTRIDTPEKMRLIERLPTQPTNSLWYPVVMGEDCAVFLIIGEKNLDFEIPEDL